VRFPMMVALVQLRGSRPADARSRLPLNFRHEEPTVHLPAGLPPQAVTLVHDAAGAPPELVPAVFPLPLVLGLPPPPSGSGTVTEQAPKLMTHAAATTKNADCTFIERLLKTTGRAWD
jgi:hypothetical protein